MSKEYTTAREISGPLLMVEGIEKASYNEIVEIKMGDGTIKGDRYLRWMAIERLFKYLKGLLD